MPGFDKQPNPKCIDLTINQVQSNVGLIIAKSKVSVLDGHPSPKCVDLIVSQVHLRCMDLTDNQV